LKFSNIPPSFRTCKFRGEILNKKFQNLIVHSRSYCGRTRGGAQVSISPTIFHDDTTKKLDHLISENKCFLCIKRSGFFVHSPYKMVSEIEPSTEQTEIVTEVSHTRPQFAKPLDLVGRLTLFPRKDLGSISSTFFEQLLCKQIPKAQKTYNLTVFFALLGSWCLKAAGKTLLKLTPSYRIKTTLFCEICYK